jgi:hypothetical protein
VLDDLSVGKEELGLLRIGELERAQEEAPGVEFDGGDAGRHGGNYGSGGEVGFRGLLLLQRMKLEVMEMPPQSSMPPHHQEQLCRIRMPEKQFASGLATCCETYFLLFG